ncbi:UBC-like protein [Trametes coccinea BRFM310]|uniref:UBC-like protein n=1 Tax=Trametes coccinea (strain BRFM310) TaxID=1353009 RepID=A0A1Y2IVU7_TRAC3|nr:UBC-like protein [Trametes coccinea BRFM310]
MASKAAYKRLSKEYVAMQKEPPPFVWAAPDEKNILTWPPDSPYAGGEYHGVLLFPSEYPFKPPGIKMLTPSGRFKPDKKICFSMSDFHPGSWNPAWSVATILTGLLSFMLSDEMTTGSVTTTDAEKRIYAAHSHAWNLQNKRFREAFPEYCTPSPRDVPNMAQKELRASASKTPPSPAPAPAPTSSAATPAANPASSTPQTPSTPTPAANDKAVARTPNGAAPSAEGANGVGQSWAASLRQMVWEKWRWGVILALALVVSRLSSSN